MNLPDFTKRSNAILILLGLDILFYVGMVVAYVWPHSSPDLRTVMRDAFIGVSSPLLLALKMGGPDTPTPSDDKGGTVQQTTTVTPAP